tara:strand:+ start:568 stop:726 length:159 start_codon:yes stop_codon:yes gene_type:complete
MRIRLPYIDLFSYLGTLRKELQEGHQVHLVAQRTIDQQVHSMCSYDTFANEN